MPIINAAEFNLNFGQAIELAKKGIKISRKGWNGKGMWVTMHEGKNLDSAVHDIWNPNIADVAAANEGKVVIRPYMIMKTVDEEIIMGWVASQTDMLATDWGVVA